MKECRCHALHEARNSENERCLQFPNFGLNFWFRFAIYFQLKLCFKFSSVSRQNERRNRFINSENIRNAMNDKTITNQSLQTHYLSK